MTTDRKLPKLAIIDDFNIFVTDVITPPLYSQLTTNYGLDVRCYVPVSRKGQDTSGIPSSSMRYIWNSVDYPLRIFSALNKDGRTAILIMLEQGTFGPPFALLQLPVLLFLCRLARFRVLVNLQGLIDLNDLQNAVSLLLPSNRLPRPILKMVLFALYASVFRLSDQIQVHAFTFGRWVLEYGDFRKKLRKVSTGVLGRPFGTQPSPVKGPYVLAFGHVVRRKGLEHVVVAWKNVHLRYPEYKLIIAGNTQKDPEYVSQLRNLISANGLGETILLTGPVSKDEMHSLFENCFAVLFPYVYSDSTSGPVSIALQYRKPIIAARIGFFEDLFGGGGAVFCEPGDKDSISQAVVSLLSSPELEKKIGAEVAVLADSLNWDDVGRLYFSLITEGND